jgi:hypothetical protein
VVRDERQSELGAGGRDLVKGGPLEQVEQVLHAGEPPEPAVGGSLVGFGQHRGGEVAAADLPDLAC